MNFYRDAINVHNNLFYFKLIWKFLLVQQKFFHAYRVIFNHVRNNIRVLLDFTQNLK